MQGIATTEAATEVQEPNEFNGLNGFYLCSSGIGRNVFNAHTLGRFSQVFHTLFMGYGEYRGPIAHNPYPSSVEVGVGVVTRNSS